MPTATLCSDSNDGVAKPWKSLQKGVDALKPGDTLNVLAGEYAIEAAITVNGKKATQEAPILIQARGKVVLRDGAQKVNTWQGILDIRDSSWITVRGFTLEQSGFFGVYPMVYALFFLGMLLKQPKNIFSFPRACLASWAWTRASRASGSGR